MRSKVQRDLAEKLKKENKTYGEIGAILGVTKDAARNLCNYKLKVNKKKTGCKPKINSKTRYAMRKEITLLKNEGKKINTTKIIRNCNLNISKTTCWRELNKSGLKYTHVRKKIILSKEHKIKRIEAITKWFSENHSWTKTIFTDEKKFSLDGPDDWGTYMLPGEKLFRNKRQCDGGGLMVWLMAMPNGLLSHKIIRGPFKSNNYIHLLETQVIPIAKLNFGNDFFLQEDNATVHKAKNVKTFLEKSAVKVLKWPAKSPDINIVEDIWRIISKKVYDGPQYNSKNALEEAIDRAVLMINEEEIDVIKTLYDSIVPRLCKILSKNGALYNK